MTPSKTIEYLCIGHLTEDLTPDGICLGGTVAYSSLTANAFRQNSGVFTSFTSKDLPEPLTGIESWIQKTNQLVRFRNQYDGKQRIQFVTQTTPPLSIVDPPKALFSAKIVHFGPILNDFDPGFVHQFDHCYKGITPQGWLRENRNGQVFSKSWETLQTILPAANAVIISKEDIGYNQQTIDAMAKLCRILVVTEAFHGATVYAGNESRHFQAPSKIEIDPTGAGDIFAAAFFILNANGYSPWQAGETATQIASISVTRKGLGSIPTREEIIGIMYQNSLSEIE